MQTSKINAPFTQMLFAYLYSNSPASRTLLLFLLSWSTGMEETRSARRQATTVPGLPFLPDAVSSMIMSIDFWRTASIRIMPSARVL